MDQYYYKGPVMLFDRCVDSKWIGETTASSIQKARSNLIYQFKKETGRTPHCKVTLPGKIIFKGESNRG